MPFTLDVRANVAPTIERLNAIKAGLGDRVITVSINETIDQTKTLMARNIAAEFNVKVSDVKQWLTISGAKRAGEKFAATLFGNPFGRKRRALNLIRFLLTAQTRTAYRRKGTIGTDVLRFRIKTGQTIAIPGTFILNVPGHPVFRRVGQGRSAIEPAYAIGIPQMFMAHKVYDPVIAFVGPKFNEVFARRLRYFLDTVRA